MNASHRPGVAVPISGRDLGGAPGSRPRLRRVGLWADGHAGSHGTRLAYVSLTEQVRWWHEFGDATIVRGIETDVKISAERVGDFLAEERAERAPVDASHEFALEVPLGDGVVTHNGPGLPPRSLGGEVVAALRPVDETR